MKAELSLIKPELVQPHGAQIPGSVQVNNVTREPVEATQRTLSPMGLTASTTCPAAGSTNQIAGSVSDAATAANSAAGNAAIVVGDARNSAGIESDRGAVPDHGAVSDQTEAALIARCQAGEPAAFHILLDCYRDRIVNLAYQLLRHHDSAEDVAQEAFTQAFTSIGSFRGESQMFTWLYRITVNLCLQRKRRAKVWESLDDADKPEQADLNTHVADKAVAKLMVEQTLDRLSEPLRVVLILREMHDLSYEEVAAVLNIPVGTVRSRLNEARRKFREAWFQAELEAQE